MSIPFAHIGARVQALRRCTFYGPERIWLGDDVSIDEGTQMDALNLAFNDSPGAIRIHIGNRSIIGRDNFLSATNCIQIGERVLFAQNVYVADAGHHYADVGVAIMDQGFSGYTGSVQIEDDCWLARNVVIVAGRGELRIGRGSVIAANSVVRNSVPAYAVVAGSPASLIRLYDPRTGTFEPIRAESDVQRIMDNREALGLPRVQPPLDRTAFHHLVAPLAIEGTVGRPGVFGVLVEDNDWEVWLATYLEAFAADDPVVLVLGVEDSRRIERIQQVYASLTTSSASPDVVVHQYEPYQRAAFLRAVSALLVDSSELHVVQSLACGTPVLSPAVSQFDRWIVDAETAVVDEDRQSLLRRAAQHADALAQLGDAGRVRIERAYGVPWVLAGERRGYAT
jgi:acetyltransferase-like isoleucine patch superfamily enzyme